MARIINYTIQPFTVSQRRIYVSDVRLLLSL
jgi:hypothetical protein